MIRTWWPYWLALLIVALCLYSSGVARPYEGWQTLSERIGR